MSRSPKCDKPLSLSIGKGVVSGVLIPMASLAMSGCASATANTVTYRAYTYACCTELTAITVWHPGQQLTLHWTPIASTTTEASPTTVVLQLTLTGPFNTVDQLKTATAANEKPRGVRTIKAAPVTVTDQAGGTPVSELDLPTDLPSGYYNLDAETASGNVSAGGGVVVQVAP